MSATRQRLSTIDLLPEDADETIVWVNKELRDGKRHKKDILAEFNARLADLGIGSVSGGTFSRYSVAKAKEFREIENERRMARDVIECLGLEGSDELTVLLVQKTKAMVSKMMKEKWADSKSILELTRAHQAAVATEKMSAANREAAEKKDAQTKKATFDFVVTAAGLSKERVKQLRLDFLGVKK
jgi:Protein of unknown function (DUF3486)